MTSPCSGGALTRLAWEAGDRVVLEELLTVPVRIV